MCRGIEEIRDPKEREGLYRSLWDSTDGFESPHDEWSKDAIYGNGGMVFYDGDERDRFMPEVRRGGADLYVVVSQPFIPQDRSRSGYRCLRPCISDASMHTPPLGSVLSISAPSTRTSGLSGSPSSYSPTRGSQYTALTIRLSLSIRFSVTDVVPADALSTV